MIDSGPAGFAKSGSKSYGDKNSSNTQALRQARIDSNKKKRAEKKERGNVRFPDLKALNTKMMHMGNNTLHAESRIEILSQLEKGEIKNILGKRIIFISWFPMIFSIFLTIVMIFTSNNTVTFISWTIFIAVIIRFLLYPAYLYYDNYTHRTTKPAILYYEEMHFWYKVHVIKTYILLMITSLILFIFSFYEAEFLTMIVSELEEAKAFKQVRLISYLKEQTFSFSVKLIALADIVIVLISIVLSNKLKKKNMKILKIKMNAINNETLSRVGQIQTAKTLDDEIEY